MKVALIPPTELLGEYNSTYHLCASDVLRNDVRQMAHYKSLATTMGNYVILDNGAYEPNSSVPLQHELGLWA